MTHNIAVLPGDGIGPEIVEQAVRVLKALDVSFDIKQAPVGGAAFDAFEHPLPPATLNLAGGHYLKVAVAIQLIKGKAAATDFQTSHAAELVIDEFSNRPVASLSTNKQRKTLTSDLEKKIKAAYPDEVYDIFLTQFVTQ